MQTIANLTSLTVKTNVFQRPVFFPRMKPVGKYPLIGSAKLPCPRHNATAIDPNREIECVNVQRNPFLRNHYVVTNEGSFFRKLR